MFGVKTLGSVYGHYANAVIAGGGNGGLVKFVVPVDNKGLCIRTVIIDIRAQVVHETVNVVHVVSMHLIVDIGKKNVYNLLDQFIQWHSLVTQHQSVDILAVRREVFS